jgi:membrane peptidoglycan carboxypeptidase
MANAYATLAADGKLLRGVAGAEHHGLAGAAGGRRQPNCRQAVRPEVARAAVDATRCVTGTRPPPAAAATGRPRPAWRGGRPAGRRARRGTTDDTRAAWFVGITPTWPRRAFIADPDNPFHFAGDGNSPKADQRRLGRAAARLAGVTATASPPPSMISAMVGASRSPGPQASGVTCPSCTGFCGRRAGSAWVC